MRVAEVVDVEEALEQFGVLDLVLQLVQELDLAVDERLQPAGEVDEDLDLLFVADAAGELGRLHHGGHGRVVGAGQLVREQFERVRARRQLGRRAARRRPFAAAQRLHDRTQIGGRPRAAAAQSVGAAEDGLGHPVGADARRDQRGDRQHGEPREHAPRARGRGACRWSAG